MRLSRAARPTFLRPAFATLIAMHFPRRPLALAAALLALGGASGCTGSDPSCVSSGTLTLCAESTDTGVSVTVSGLAGYTSASVGWDGRTDRTEVPPTAQGSLPDEYSVVLVPVPDSDQVALDAVGDGATTTLTVKP